MKNPESESGEVTVTKLIPIAAIAAALFNSRDYDVVRQAVVEDGEVIKDERIDALMESMTVDGLKQPIGVRLIVDDGDASKYRLIWGSRRKLAAEGLKWTYIEAKVHPISATSDTDDVIANSTENFQRQDLTTYEKARTFSELRKRKVKIEVIVTKSGFNGSYISKLVSCFTKLHPDIVGAWKGGSSYADIPFLYELSKEPQKEQPAMWEAHIEAAASEAEEGADDKSDKPAKGPRAQPEEVIRVPKSRYTRVVRLMSQKKVPAAAIEIAKYLAGKTKVCTVLGINDDAEK